MAVIVLVISGAGFTLTGIALGWFAIRGYRLYRGVRLVACPETSAPAAVTLDVARATMTRAVANVDYRLKSCSRWPERGNCGQQCLSQIKASPQGCRVQSILARSYQGAHCALCGIDIASVGRGLHKPVLMSRDRRTRVEWDAVAPQDLPRILSTHFKICWNCQMEESFRSFHPENLRRARAS